ncbi:unnamed protein product [Brassicogethes aeneus]|uniref:Chitin-binding type-2 domain-containing protein n=1 Tax=Brassicogethes aeneus TaxID=1431903 RepID=A0A9P0BBH1_BRAAE|nr:unnamed protein product [Brassicogethes aeneus]
MLVEKSLCLLVLCLCLCESRISKHINNGRIDDTESRYVNEDNERDFQDSSDSREAANHLGDTEAANANFPDFPTYEQVPKTGFSCRAKLSWRYYADPETGCQAFHICETEYSKISFLCPTGSVFNQRHLVCDWWYNVDCNEAESFYTLSNDFNESKLGDQEDQESEFDLSSASSGGNNEAADSKSKENRNRKKV